MKKDPAKAQGKRNKIFLSRMKEGKHCRILENFHIIFHISYFIL